MLWSMSFQEKPNLILFSLSIHCPTWAVFIFFCATSKNSLMLQNHSNGERLKRESRRYICNNENLDMVNTKQTFIISFCVFKRRIDLLCSRMMNKKLQSHVKITNKQKMVLFRTINHNISFFSSYKLIVHRM